MANRKVGHIVFGRRELTGRDVVVARLATAQNAADGVSAVVLAAGREAYHRNLLEKGAPLHPFPEGHGLLAWLRTAMRFARFDPRGIGVTVLHGHGCRALFLVSFLRLIRRPGWVKLPFVYTNHGFFEDTWMHRFSLWWELFCLRWADRFVVCSRAQVGRLRERGVKSCPLVVHNGVPSVDPHERDHRHTLLVGLVGRLSREKRPDVFIRACEAVPSGRFVIVGDGPLKEESVRLADALGVAGKVSFLGHLDDVGPVYRDLDVLVLTSDFEGTPLVVLEAMAHGLPVVATTVGDVPVLIRDGREGFLVPPGDTAGLAEAITRLLHDVSLRSAMGARARFRFEEHFTIAAMADAYAAIYDDLR
jgi:glycosyltransferase involved in cell wall biosynthesis